MKQKLDYYTTTNLNSSCDNWPVSKSSPMRQNSDCLVATSSISLSTRCQLRRSDEIELRWNCIMLVGRHLSVTAIYHSDHRGLEC
jgi:hypothetical protein